MNKILYWCIKHRIIQKTTTGNEKERYPLYTWFWVDYKTGESYFCHILLWPFVALGLIVYNTPLIPTSSLGKRIAYLEGMIDGFDVAINQVTDTTATIYNEVSQTPDKKQ